MQHKGTRTIETKRLWLRAFCEDDALAAYQNWMHDDKVVTYLRWSKHEDIHVTKRILHEWIKQYEHKEYYQWAIVLKDTMEPMGSIGVVDQNERLAMVHLGYCIGSKWWHKGYTSEALSAVIKFLFEEVQVNRIESQHDPRNLHSGDVMKKCGMRYEGTLRQADYNHQGIVDACIYALLAKDYAEEISGGTYDREKL